MKKQRLTHKSGKVYTMKQVDDHHFMSTWGSAENPISCTHDMKLWDEVTKNKTANGYEVMPSEANESTTTVLESYDAFVARELLSSGKIITSYEMFLERYSEDGGELPGDEDEDVEGLNIADHIIDMQQKIVDAM